MNPFEVATEPGGRAFLTFVTDKGAQSWPWHGVKAMRLSLEADTLCFDYATHTVEVWGNGLGVLADLASATRLKLVRVGRADDTVIHRIRIVGDESMTC